MLCIHDKVHRSISAGLPRSHPPHTHLFIFLYPYVFNPPFSAHAYIKKARTLWTIYKQYKEVNAFLSTGNTTIDRPNYTRLFILSALDVIVSLPLLIFITISEFTSGPVLFWPGWSFIHQYIGQVVQASTEEWNHLGGFWLRFYLKWNQWIGPVWAVIFFALFGLTEDARMRYKSIFWAVMKPFGLKPREVLETPQEQMFYAQPESAPASRSLSSLSY